MPPEPRGEVRQEARDWHHQHKIRVFQCMLQAGSDLNGTGDIYAGEVGVIFAETNEVLGLLFATCP
jgi:hypothetical protein